MKDPGDPSSNPSKEREIDPDGGKPVPYDDEYIERLVMHFYSVVCLPRYKVKDLPEEFSGIKSARELDGVLWGIRNLTEALSKGDLEYVCHERGLTVGSLKAFQSNLRHLTWQAQRIAAGEYQHRVDFLGDFSAAFNHMAEQLAGRIETLVDKAEEYKDMSYRDGLTGVYNREAFSRLAGKFLSHNVNPSGAAVLVLCDIDHFKKLNDTYGHLCGDEVLRAFADKLTSVLRPTDFCFRYGGEEFILVMSNTFLKQGVLATERLCAAVEKMRAEYEGQQLQITASFGVAGIKPCDEGSDVEAYLTQCVRRADESLYKAKAGGRNRVVVDAE